MRTAMVVKESDVLKDHRRISPGLEERIKRIAVDVLEGNLSSELHGIALEVMKAVMEFEIGEDTTPDRSSSTVSRMPVLFLVQLSSRPRKALRSRATSCSARPPRQSAKPATH